MKILAIRKEIDLKKLKKYGFEEKNFINGKVYIKSISNGKYEIYYHIRKDKIIHLNQFGVNNKLDTTLYDLTKDNLIELVESEVK